MAGLVVWTGDMVDACSETWLTRYCSVTLIEVMRWEAKNTP